MCEKEPPIGFIPPKIPKFVFKPEDSENPNEKATATATSKEGDLMMNENNQTDDRTRWEQSKYREIIQNLICVFLNMWLELEVLMDVYPQILDPAMEDTSKAYVSRSENSLRVIKANLDRAKSAYERLKGVYPGKLIPHMVSYELSKLHSGYVIPAPNEYNYEFRDEKDLELLKAFADAVQEDNDQILIGVRDFREATELLGKVYDLHVEALKNMKESAKLSDRSQEERNFAKEDPSYARLAESIRIKQELEYDQMFRSISAHTLRQEIMQNAYEAGVRINNIRSVLLKFYTSRDIIAKAMHVELTNLPSNEYWVTYYDFNGWAHRLTTEEVESEA